MHVPLSDQADPPSVYAQAAPPPPSTVALTGRPHVAVAVIGAGFTGLSAALHLAEAGVDVAVLEAKEIGWGASGRAFGQVVPYLKIGHGDDPAPLRAGARGARHRRHRRRARPGVRADRAARDRLLGGAHRADLRRARAGGTARSGAPHRLLAGPRRAGRNAGRGSLRRGGGLVAVSGGVVGSAGRQSQSVGLCARAGARGGGGRGGDPHADAGARHRAARSGAGRWTPGRRG